jgi:hypothetical protein
MIESHIDIGDKSAHSQRYIALRTDYR